MERFSFWLIHCGQIQKATGIRRETASQCLKAVGIAVRPVRGQRAANRLRK
jgi:hypothetical protein